ncbi:MAG: alpha/beta fold hydrolase [Alphaproteobacteria bacterium]|nr:alpha/beta fold hydrolase [Alphaproteobacteria bacterium]
MRNPVRFPVDGISLAGTFSLKDDTKGRVPGVVLAHGFAGARYPKMAAHFASLGYGVLELDFRGYGESGGERGHVIPREQVADIGGAVGWLAQRPEIDPERIAVVGSSLGGSIAIMVAAEDKRIKVCVAGCPLAKGDSAFRVQYNTEEKYGAFLKRVDEARRKNERLLRFDLVFIPEKLRGFLPPGTPMEFYADTVDGFLSLNPMAAIGKVSPRPLLIIHAKDDHVVPVADARELAAHGGKTCDLELLETGDHFIFGVDAVGQKIGGWLKRHLPT